MRTHSYLSFRGASGDEESRPALKNSQSQILRFAQNDSFKTFARRLVRWEGKSKNRSLTPGP